jgi:hypothetical protein
MAAYMLASASRARLAARPLVVRAPAIDGTSARLNASAIGARLHAETNGRANDESRHLHGDARPQQQCPTRHGTAQHLFDRGAKCASAAVLSARPRPAARTPSASTNPGVIQAPGVASRYRAPRT